VGPVLAVAGAARAEEHQSDREQPLAMVGLRMGPEPPNVPAAPGAPAVVRRVRLAWTGWTGACLILTFLLGCERRAEVVSCSTEWLGMCHEWFHRTASERRELRDAVCQKSDDRYVERACPKDDALGACELPATRERTVWYRERVPKGFDPRAPCSASGGEWHEAP
jgi:hypothetical protein